MFSLSLSFLSWLLALFKVYPIGIPSLYFFILWTNRESLNPMIARRGAPEVEDGVCDEAEESSTVDTTRPRKLERRDSILLEEKLQERTTNPDLVPSMFLWKDFGKQRILIPNPLPVFSSSPNPSASCRVSNSMSCNISVGLRSIDLLNFPPRSMWQDRTRTTTR